MGPIWFQSLIYSLLFMILSPNMEITRNQKVGRTMTSMTSHDHHIGNEDFFHCLTFALLVICLFSIPYLKISLISLPHFLCKFSFSKKSSTLNLKYKSSHLRAYLTRLKDFQSHARANRLSL